MGIGGIGSVQPTPDHEGRGILNEWTYGSYWSGFRTARAALAALLRQRRISRLWLPAYICSALKEAAEVAGTAIEWYGVDAELNAVTSDLKRARSEDAVLGVCYFGRPLDPGLGDLMAARSDLLWIEDRSQALRPGGSSTAKALLYSPRKLFGVGDGGLLVTRDPNPPLPDLVAIDADSDPNAARRLDPDGRSPEHWFPLFQAREAGMDASPRAMSADTVCALKTLDAEAEAIARKRNWAYLDTHLSAIGLFPEREIDFVPLAYPIIVPDAGAFSAHLARSRIWCARHWPNLPSPPSFEPAQTLSRCCLSLPLDGRYDLKDMARIVDAVKLYLL